MATPTTLPATFVSGDVLEAAQLNALRGAFRVLQVIEGTVSTQVVTTSTSYVTTNLTASITPSATSSKVLVLVNLPVGKDSSGSGGINTALFRGTVAGTNLAETLLFAGANSTYMMSTYSFLDSPNTTSATAYTVGIKSGSVLTSVYGNADNKRSSIILMEISA
jgi:hypothetical protein